MTEMRALIATLPDQLRWAADLTPPAVAASREAVVAGMGGSGIAGDIAAVVAESQGRRVSVHKSYDLPGWVTPDTLVVGVSHSGNTEETLSAVAAAQAVGLAVTSTSVGGKLAAVAAHAVSPHIAIPDSPQPRAALGRIVGCVLRLLESAGVIEPASDALREAAAAVEEVLSTAIEASDRIADELSGRVAVIYGGPGVGSVAASRWKAQINENSKAPAFWSTLPESNHNEIVGWTAYPGLSRDAMAVVFLNDSEDHPQVRLRSKITRELIEMSVPVAGVVGSRGTGVLARMMSLSVIGDLVSVRLAELAGVDPVPVDVVEDLKRRLAAEA